MKRGMTMAKYKPKHKLPPFVALPWAMLNHKAYQSLPPTAKGMLPYFLGQVKIPSADPSYYHATFTFSYTEAQRYGCARRSFYRVICDLMDHGFIEPVYKGNRSGGRNNSSIFRLSKRWLKYDAPDFQKVSWPQFGATQIQKQVHNWHSPVAQNKPGTERGEKRVCQQ